LGIVKARGASLPMPIEMPAWRFSALTQRAVRIAPEP
jgi:hypothetical protein